MFPDPYDLADHLDEGRTAALRLMVDTCRITKPGAGKGEFNEGTGQYDAPAPITVYEGPCQLQIKADINSNVVEVTAGEKEWAYLTSTLKIPVSLDSLLLEDRVVLGDPSDVRIDHTAEILEANHDPDLVGRKYQIRAIHHKTYATSRRLRVTEAV